MGHGKCQSEQIGTGRGDSQHWRDTILSAPSLWGKLLDLDDLLSSGDEWQVEVLRRSGKASLWIKITDRIKTTCSHVRGLPKSTFFSELLEKHWNRVELLLLGEGICADHYPLISRAIHLPAPRLRVVDITFNWCHIDSTSAQSLKALFANNAPLLHTFHALGARFDRHAPWLGSIRSIRIGRPFTLPKMFAAFKMMPLLENIHADFDCPMPIITDHLPQVHLPNINHIHLSSDFSACLSFMEYVNPARGCSLILEARGPRDEFLISDHLMASLGSLSKFVENYFANHVSTAISLEFSPRSFCIQDKTGIQSSTIEFSAMVSVSYWDTLPLYVMGHIFFTAFTLPPPIFDGVTQLKLKYLNFLPPRNNFASFFLSFSSVKLLITDEKSIGEFLDVQKGTSQVLLPLLDILKLDILNLNGFDSLHGPLFPFLRARRALVHPISVLDLTKCVMNASPSLKFLEEMEGMTVRWIKEGTEVVSEYECGSGHPEILSF